MVAGRLPATICRSVSIKGSAKPGLTVKFVHRESNKRQVITKAKFKRGLISQHEKR